jgi:hypothetical protein
MSGSGLTTNYHLTSGECAWEDFNYGEVTLNCLPNVLSISLDLYRDGIDQPNVLALASNGIELRLSLRN